MCNLIMIDKLLFILTLPHFILSSTTFSPPSQSLKVKAVPPVYSVELNDVTMYEATIPIFFHVELPKIPEDFPSHKVYTSRNYKYCAGGDVSGHRENNDNTTGSSGNSDYNRYQCALERQFILVSNHITKDLQEMQEMPPRPKHDGNGNFQNYSHAEHQNMSGSTNNPGRKKRQVVPIIAATSVLAGFLLRPAISKLTGNLFGSNEEWEKHFNAIRESLITDHELLLDFEHSAQVYSEEMSEILTKISILLSEEKRDLIWSLRLLSAKMHADVIQDAIHSCKTKHLPGNLIKPKFLQKTLSALDKNLTSYFNYTLAIDATDDSLGKYYKLPIVDCIFAEGKAHITINIPLKRKDAHWKLYEIIHTKYAFHHQICEVYPQEATYLAEQTGANSRSVLITKHMLRYCSIYEDRLCMVPQYGKDSVQSLRCTLGGKVFNAKAGVLNKTDTILKSCSFRCYSNDEVIITQVADTKVVVTNADHLVYQCGAGSNYIKETIQLGRIGAVEINLNCGCVVKINGEQTLTTPFRCISNKTIIRHDIFTYIVPLAWSHNLSALLGKEGFDDFIVTDDHEKLGAYINHHWSGLVPVLNFTKEQEEKLQNFTVPETAEVKGADVSSAVQMWLVILSVAVILHIFITFYCCCKLFFIRMGEYELPSSYREKELENVGWFMRRFGRSSERSHQSRHHNNHRRNSHSSNQSGRSSNGSNNRRHNFEVYQKQQSSKPDKLNDSQHSSDGTTVSLKSTDESYHSNRNSVINKLI